MKQLFNFQMVHIMYKLTLMCKKSFRVICNSHVMISLPFNDSSKSPSRQDSLNSASLCGYKSSKFMSRFVRISCFTFSSMNLFLSRQTRRLYVGETRPGRTSRTNVSNGRQGRTTGTYIWDVGQGRTSGTYA